MGNNTTDFLEKGSKFILDNPKIIKNIYRIPNYNDEPQLYQYFSQFTDKYHPELTKEAVASGVSFEKNRALLKLLGETAERYALSLNNHKKFINKSFYELSNDHRNAINPIEVALITDSSNKNQQKDLVNTKFNWIEGKSLITNKNIFIPAQLVFIPYVFQESEVSLQMPISTGAAAGEFMYDAVYRGICEVIERDSFMIHYYNTLNSPKINLETCKNKTITKIIAALKRYNLELCVNDITTDVGVSAVASIIVDKTGLGPAISIGLKAGFDIEENIIGAIEEALMVRVWIRDEFVYLKPKYRAAKTIRTIEERAEFWFPTDMIHYLDFWLNAKNKRSLNKVQKSKLNSYEEKVSELIKIFSTKGYDVIYVDITVPVIRKYDVKVVKVIIPQLQPLHLDEKYPYLTFQRMYNAPINMGVFGKSKSLKKLNHIPHPFL